eukprot:6480587-Alexandrium_andersonii.AAC.1
MPQDNTRRSSIARIDATYAAKQSSHDATQQHECIRMCQDANNDADTVPNDSNQMSGVLHS